VSMKPPVMVVSTGENVRQIFSQIQLNGLWPDAEASTTHVGLGAGPRARGPGPDPGGSPGGGASGSSTVRGTTSQQGAPP